MIKRISHPDTNEVFLEMLIMNNKEISHFVRNDGVSPSDGGWKSGGEAATFPPTDDTHGVSFRPREKSHFYYQTSLELMPFFKWLVLEMTAGRGCIGRRYAANLLPYFNPCVLSFQPKGDISNHQSHHP